MAGTFQAPATARGRLSSCGLIAVEFSAAASPAVRMFTPIAVVITGGGNVDVTKHSVAGVPPRGVPV